MSPSAHVAQVIADYAQREPGETDAWTPLTSDFELSLRLCLFYAMRETLRALVVPPQTLHILDVGCGTGRSTRMYVDLGCSPERITGLDLRPGAIALARRLHPGIRWVVHDGGSPLHDGEPPELLSTLGVFSSIRGRAGRAALAQQVVDALPPGAHLFYFDRFRANDFAGRDRLRPARLFPACTPVWHRYFWQHEFLPRRHRARALWTIATRPGVYRALRTRLVHRLLPSFEVLCCRRT